jgi:hypothetical protein
LKRIPLSRQKKHKIREVEQSSNALKIFFFLLLFLLLIIGLGTKNTDGQKATTQG